MQISEILGACEKLGDLWSLYDMNVKQMEFIGGSYLKYANMYYNFIMIDF